MAVIEIKPYGNNGEIAGVATSCRMRVRMERGGLNGSTGAMVHSIDSYNGYIRSSMLIKLNGATKVTGVNLNGFTVYEYGSTFGFLGTSNEGAAFRSTCRYIKIAKQSSTLPDEVFLSFDGFPEEVYNVQIEKGISNNVLLSEKLVFEVDDGVCTTARLLLPPNYSINGDKVPLFIYSSCDGSYQSSGSDHGWDFIIGSNNSLRNLKEELQYMADEGFAVLNIYPWGSYNNINFPKCGWSGAIPVPVTLKAYEKAVEYVTSRFNISREFVFQASHSGSGKLSSFYASHRPNFNLRHIYAFAPVVDGFCFASYGATYTDMRKAMHHEMNYDLSAGNGSIFNAQTDTSWLIHSADGKAFILANAGKFAQSAMINWLNLTEQTEAEKWDDTVDFGDRWNTVRSKSGGATLSDWESLDTDPNKIYCRDDLSVIGDGVPITILGAVDDADCPYLVMREFVRQLQNGGGDAEIVTLPMVDTEEYGEHHPLNKGHRAAVYYHTKANVQTRYGGTYSTVPYGWWYAVQDIYTKYLNN